MTRRSVIKRTLVVFSAAFMLPNTVRATMGLPPVLSPRGPITIAQLMAASFPAVREAMLGGNHWSHRALVEAEAQGRIDVRDLGIAISFPPEGIRTVEQLSCPILWSDEDDQRTSRPIDKASFVANQLERAFKTLDEMMLGRLGSGRAVASTEYRYAKGETVEIGSNIPGRRQYHTMLYTGAAFSELPPT
jgi:hypothetical protein